MAESVTSSALFVSRVQHRHVCNVCLAWTLKKIKLKKTWPADTHARAHAKLQPHTDFQLVSQPDVVHTHRGPDAVVVCCRPGSSELVVLRPAGDDGQRGAIVIDVAVVRGVVVVEFDRKVNAQVARGPGG